MCRFFLIFTVDLFNPAPGPKLALGCACSFWLFVASSTIVVLSKLKTIYISVSSEHLVYILLKCRHHAAVPMRKPHDIQ